MREIPRISPVYQLSNVLRVQQARVSPVFCVSEFDIRTVYDVFIRFTSEQMGNFEGTRGAFSAPRVYLRELPNIYLYIR